MEDLRDEIPYLFLKDVLKSLIYSSVSDLGVFCVYERSQQEQHIWPLLVAQIDEVLQELILKVSW